MPSLDNLYKDGSFKNLQIFAVNVEQPNILKDYANTSSAGSIIAFSQFNSDLESGDIGVLCSFGAGYSAGSIILKKN